jgi:hypothetical protein
MPERIPSLLEQAIKSIYRVRDAGGWLADKM